MALSAVLCVRILAWTLHGCCIGPAPSDTVARPSVTMNRRTTTKRQLCHLCRLYRLCCFHHIYALSPLHAWLPSLTVRSGLLPPPSPSIVCPLLSSSSDVIASLPSTRPLARCSLASFSPLLPSRTCSFCHGLSLLSFAHHPLPSCVLNPPLSTRKRQARALTRAPSPPGSRTLLYRDLTGLGFQVLRLPNGSLSLERRLY